VALVLRRIVSHRTRDAVLQVNSLAIPLALALGCHFAMPKGARLSVSRQPQEVTASPLPEAGLVKASK